MEEAILEFIVRSTLIAVFTAVALYVLRVQAARVRHAIWASVVVSMLVLPVWIAWGPKAVLRVMTPKPGRTEVVRSQVLMPERNATASARRTAVWNRQDWLATIYLLGLCALLARLAIGTARARNLVRRAGRREGRLTSDSCVAPVTVGWLNPTVLLPPAWMRWPQEQLDAVLAHESEHARHRDPLVQWLGLLNRAIFWFHPLAWWLSRRLAALAEEACDDAVLACGHDPLRYSGYLLELARVVQRAGLRANVVGMAMPGNFLLRRIPRIVAGIPAQRISRGRMACLAATCLVLSVASTAVAVGYYAPDATSQNVPMPVVLAQPLPRDPAAPKMLSPKRKTSLLAQAKANPVMPTSTAPNSTDFGQSLEGAVVDPSNAVVPKVRATLTNTGTGFALSTATVAIGTFRFPNIEPGNYNLTLEAPGFKRFQAAVVVNAGEAFNAGKIDLQLGAMNESVTVVGQRTTASPTALPAVNSPPVPTTLGPVTTVGPMTTISSSTASPDRPPGASKAGPIRVGGNVQPANLVNPIRPVYPPDALQEGVGGTVKLEVVISKEGVPEDLRIVNDKVDSRLAMAALDCVKQWRYKPTLLNGEPVEFLTTIDMTFQPGN